MDQNFFHGPRVSALKMQAQIQRQESAFLTDSLTNLYGVAAAEIACNYALADLCDAQAEHLTADSAFRHAAAKIMQPSADALSFAASIGIKVRLFKLANELAQQSQALTLSNLLLQQAMSIVATHGQSDDEDQTVIFTLNQISQAAFELVDVEKFQATSKQSQELLANLN